MALRIKRLQECREFTSGDNCQLRELFNARTENVSFRYSLAHAVVRPGRTTRPHKLKTSEVYYILSGNGRIFIDDECADIESGAAVDIPPHATQYIQNTGTDDLIFLCIVDPAWRSEDEEII